MSFRSANKNTFPLSSRFKQAGLTLTELMVSLAVAGLLVGGAVMFARSAGDQQSSNQHTSEAVGFRSAMRSLFNGQGNFGSTTATYASQNATLVSAGKVPATLSASGSTITNSWGGAVDVMGNNANFYLSTASVPKTVCIDLVSQAIQAGWNGVGVGGAYPGTSSSTTIVSPATAATYCSAAANTIYLTGS